MAEEAPTAPGQNEANDVVRNDAEHRYEIRHGGRLAGFAVYRERGDRTVFVHTEIGDDFGGKGLGSILARHALDDVVERGRTIVPVCPFISAYLRKHPEYEAHVSWPSEHERAEHSENAETAESAETTDPADHA